jgi:hypothetical protein
MHQSHGPVIASPPVSSHAVQPGIKGRPVLLDSPTALVLVVSPSCHPV